MPWTPADATAKTHRADTAPKRRQWAAIANKALASTGSDSSAIRIANSAVRNHPSHKRLSLSSLKD
jgi:hypothetical protein